MSTLVVGIVVTAMIREDDVRNKLAALWRREISLEQFEDWLAQASWAMHNDSRADAIDLVSSIHLLLSERDDHIIDEVELRHQFLRLLNDIVVREPVDARPLSYYASNVSLFRPPPASALVLA